MLSPSDQIGGKLRRIRKSRRMTLEALAGHTGFTKSYLSKIENAKSIPPIGSLAKICRALDTNLADLFGDAAVPPETEPRHCIVRAGERHTVIRGGTSFGYDYKALAPRLHHKHMEPFLFTFPERLGTEIRFEHEGEEFIFVISGRVRFFIADEETILEPGDSIYFDSTLRHRGEAVNGEAKALVVVYSPRDPA